MTTPTAADLPATALIAEDEPLLAEALAADLARLWPALRIVARVGDGLSAAAQALALRPQVCFLDIRMPGASGLEAAQALAEDWPDDTPFPLLVFVTAYDAYALAAFDAQAMDYLVKPVAPDRLAACVARLQRRLADLADLADPDARTAGTAAAADGAGPPAAAPADAALQQTLDQLRALLGAAPGTAAAPRLAVIQAAVGNTVHFVPIDEVLYLEAADKYLRVVTAGREHLIRQSLRELLPQLDPALFWQVHRSVVVRATAISTAQRDEAGRVWLQLRGRTERLAVSRLYAHRFKGQ